MSELYSFPYKTAGSDQDIVEHHKPRQRVSKACDRCRNQKIKCSGTYPCVTCLKHKKDCRFTPSNYQLNGESNAKRQKRDAMSNIVDSVEPMLSMQSTKIPVPEKMSKELEKDEYVTQLENRVKYLENLLSNDSDSLFRRDTMRESQQPSEPKHCFSLLSSSSKWRFSKRHQNLLTVLFAENLYESLSDEYKAKVTLPRTQYFGWNMSGVHYLKPEKLPDEPEITVKLPLSQSQYIDFYFREVNALFSILHETVFRAQMLKYETVKGETADMNPENRDSKAHSTKLFSAQLCLIQAIAIRLSEFQKPAGPQLAVLKVEEQLFKYGFRVVEILSFEWESFELIQSWLLITLYLRLCHRQTSTFTSLGRAITMVRSMGLSYNVPSSFKATPYELLKSKRIFWSVYTMDRLFGTQQGRYCGIRDEDIYRSFPKLDYEIESTDEDWWTKPAFAMFHIAKVSNFVHTLVRDTPHPEKLNQVNNELDRLDKWFDDNGFGDEQIYMTVDQYSPLVKVQTKLHFFDLVISLHGRVLFNFTGHHIPNEGLQIERVLSVCERIIYILHETERAGLLMTPWYMTMLLLYNSGLNVLTLINGGYEVKRSKQVLKNVIRLMLILNKSNVIDENTGKIVYKERFKMAKECLWALKVLNHLLLLRFQEDQNFLEKIGVDHGSADVNKQVFNQMGKFTERGDEEYFTGNEVIVESDKNVETPGSINSSMNLNKEITEELLGNLQWFDQWVDFTYDL